MRRAAILALLLLATLRLFADCSATKAPSQYSVEFHSPACTSASPCVQNKAIHFSVTPANGCYIPFYPGPCPAPYVIDACDMLTWDFGDGTPVRQVSGSGQVDHVFSKAGNFPVSVSVQNAHGAATVRGSAYVCADPPTYVHFATDRYAANETDGTVTITVERSGDTSRAFSLDYGTAYGLPNGSFFRNLEIVNTTLSFAAGETTKQVVHKIQNDNVFKGDFDYSVGVVNDGDVVMDGGPVETTTIHIADDEPGPEFTIDDVTVPEGNGAHIVEVPLHLSSPAGDYVNVWCLPHDGTAKAPVDFAPYGFSAAFEPGQMTSKCEIKIFGNNRPELDKMLTIVADPVLGPVKVVRNSAQLTLTNDDTVVVPPPPPPPPPLSITFEPRTFRMITGTVEAVTLNASVAATVTLTSSDPTVVEVGSSASAPGSVRLVALRPGTAVITATSDTASASIDVEVLPPPRRRSLR